MIHQIVVSLWCYINLFSGGVQFFQVLWILNAILFLNGVLHSFRKGICAEARLFQKRFASDGYTPSNRHHAFATNKPEAFLAATAISEVYLQREIECGMRRCFWVLVYSQHHIGHVAPVFPVAQPAGRHDADRANGTEDEMQTGEQVHK